MKCGQKCHLSDKSKGKLSRLGLKYVAAHPFYSSLSSTTTPKIGQKFSKMMTVYIFTVVIMNVGGDLGVMMGVKSLVVLQNMKTLILTSYTQYWMLRHDVKSDDS